MIDQKQIETWRILLDSRPEDMENPASYAGRVAASAFCRSAREAIGALIAEVERLTKERDEALMSGALATAAGLRGDLEALAKDARALRQDGLAATLDRLAGGLRPAVIHPEVSRLTGEVGRLRGLLREIEWKGGDDPPDNFCPLCVRSPSAHAPDCRLAAALK